MEIDLIDCLYLLCPNPDKDASATRMGAQLLAIGPSFASWAWTAMEAGKGDYFLLVA